MAYFRSASKILQITVVTFTGIHISTNTLCPKRERVEVHLQIFQNCLLQTLWAAVIEK